VERISEFSLCLSELWDSSREDPTPLADVNTFADVESQAQTMLRKMCPVKLSHKSP